MQRVVISTEGERSAKGARRTYVLIESPPEMRDASNPNPPVPDQRLHVFADTLVHMLRHPQYEASAIRILEALALDGQVIKTTYKSGRVGYALYVPLVNRKSSRKLRRQRAPEWWEQTEPRFE